MAESVSRVQSDYRDVTDHCASSSILQDESPPPYTAAAADENDDQPPKYETICTRESQELPPPYPATSELLPLNERDLTVACRAAAEPVSMVMPYRRENWEARNQKMQWCTVHIILAGISFFFCCCFATAAIILAGNC